VPREAFDPADSREGARGYTRDPRLRCLPRLCALPLLVSLLSYRINCLFFLLFRTLKGVTVSHRIAAKITGVAGYVPPCIQTNADLEKIVDTNDEWIRTRTGIRERRVAGNGVASSHMATEAAQALLAKTNTDPAEIDLIILASVTPDMFFPATACLIQQRIGAKSAWGFDLSAACSGFVYALTVGAQFVASGAHKKVLVIGSDKMTSILDYRDRATCVLFGDGAGAVLVEPARDGEGILDFTHDVDGSGGQFLYMPAGGSLNPSSHDTVDKRMHYVHQEGSQVFKYAVRRMAEMAANLLKRNGFTSKDVALVVPHQANLRIIRAMQERLGVDDSKVLVNIDRYGNTTAGTIPLGLCDALGQGRLRKGDLVMLVAVGAGYTSGGILLRWAY
jgi:3-oxoacyl-[acyl-carrier-protein] synthase III